MAANYRGLSSREDATLTQNNKASHFGVENLERFSESMAVVT